jgi:hypothetical protein
MPVNSNFTWAQELAKQKLMDVERKEENGVSFVDSLKTASADLSLKDMPSLPAEVWSSVASMLAGESDSSAIAQLNVACSDIHHATLPTLYETVHFKSLERLQHMVAMGRTDRWKYVK